MESELETIEAEIIKLSKENEEIITYLNLCKTSPFPFVKKVYKIFPKEFTADSSPFDPYVFECKTVDIKMSKSEWISQWKVHPSLEKPEEVDQDKLLYGENKEIMDMKCECFGDLIRINGHLGVCLRYLSLLRESASLKFGKKFKINFQRVQNILKLMQQEIQKEGEDSDSVKKAIEGSVDDLNKQITQIFKNGVVYNELRGIKIDSNILNEEMKEAFVKLIPCWKKYSFNVLLSFKYTEINVNNNQFTQDFRYAVVGKSNILIVVQSKDNSVFGAFVKERFYDQNQGMLVNLPNDINLETFLFYLKKTEHNFSATKWLKPEGKISQFHCHCGLHMDNDFILFCQYSWSPENSFNRVAPGFQKDLDIFAPKGEFSPHIIEVFSLNDKK